MQVETECTRISLRQCGEVWMGIGSFVQRIPTLAIYLENEPRKQKAEKQPGRTRYTSRLSRPAAALASKILILMTSWLVIFLSSTSV